MFKFLDKAKVWFHSYEFIPSKKSTSVENTILFDRILEGIRDDTNKYPFWSMYKNDKKIKITVLVEYDYE